MSKEQKNILHTYKRVLLDVNVCIDLVTRRNTKFNSKEFIEVLLENNISPIIASNTLDTFNYILMSNYFSRNKAMVLTSKLIELSTQIHLSDKAVKYALNSDFNDFEDSLINANAVVENIDAIITSNIKDFKNSILPIYSPLEFIKLSN